LSPQTPPPPTIPTLPAWMTPSPLPSSARPAKLFDFRPTLGVSEEYSDNFNRTATNQVSNFRSTISPGFQALLNYGSLTGQASYTLGVVYDSSVEDVSFQHFFAGLLGWQATPRLRFTVSDSLARTDNPSQVNQLNLQLNRQQYTTNQFSLTADYSLHALKTSAYYRLSTFTSGGLSASSGGLSTTSGESTTTTQTPGATVSYALGRLHTLTLGYEYLDSETTGNASGISNSTITGHQVTGTFSR